MSGARALLTMNYVIVTRSIAAPGTPLSSLTLGVLSVAPVVVTGAR